MWKRLLFAVVVSFGAYSWWSTRAISHAPGVIAPTAPIQTDIQGKAPFMLNSYRVTPLKQFVVEARVLARENYSLGRESKLSTLDLALGWGPMSDEAVLKKIAISQSNRFYYWQVSDFPIPRAAIEAHSANMHLISADARVAAKLKQVRKGHVVRLSGYLVRVDAADGWHWKSSTSRTDTGDGACELIWVEEVSLR